MLNLKKLATLLTVLCSVSMASSAFLVPAAHATSGGPQPCYDITNSGTPVLFPGPGGVANSGTLIFDPMGAPPGPDTQYEACVTDPGNDGKGMFDVKGWAWDSNLGWVSLSCTDENLDGPPYENLGLSCGNQIYGVQMEGTDQPNPGRLHGYAYGDNTGWINFSCIGGVDSLGGSCESSGPFDYYVQAETTDTACLGEVYSSTPPSGSCSVNLNESTYAFSDNVGWLDLTGVQFPWIDLISAAVKVDFQILMPDGTTPLGSTVLDKNNSAVADGSDGYIFRLHITKLDGTPIDPSLYTIVANVTWNADTVDINQTDAANGDCSTSSVAPDCAVSKPLSIGDFLSYAAYNPATASFDYKVTSVAPTTGVNGYDKDGNGTVDFSYEQFVLGGPGFSVPSNLLQLGDVKVSVMANASGICSFGDTFGGCDPTSVLDPAPRTLEFLPAIELNELKDAVSDYTMNAQYTVANTLNYSTACRGALSACDPSTISLQTGVDAPFVLVYGSVGSVCTDSSLFGVPSQVSWSPTVTSFQITPLFAPVAGVCPTGISETTGTNAFIKSTVDYTLAGKSVEYFSNKLPRVKGTLVVNPVAEIRGSVYSTGVTNPLTGKTVRSIGDVSTNILRNVVFQNVKNMVAGHTVTSGDATLSMSGTGAFTIAPSTIGSGLLPDAKGPTVYYFNGGKVSIGDSSSSSNLSWDGNRTVVVEGGDVYINQGLLNSSAVSPKPKFGLIVLKDLTTGKGGNVYIAPGVKNIQANIFADGAVFSYDPARGVLANGEPNFADEAGRYNVLLNQLYIDGSIASQNTVGGAVAMPKPILGNGQLADASEGSYGATPSGRSEARLYDLNFLRYYGLVFQRDPITFDAIDQQGQSPGDPCYLVAKALTDDPSCNDLILNPAGSPALDPSTGAPFTGLSAVYISFDPPPANLPGFGVTTGVSQTVRPQ